MVLWKYECEKTKPKLSMYIKLMLKKNDKKNVQNKEKGLRKHLKKNFFLLKSETLRTSRSSDYKKKNDK